MGDYLDMPSTKKIGPQDELPDAANRLGVEPVHKLMIRFSIPSIMGMLVNALYNVVDRIFVGRGVGEIALGGLSLVMPLMVISLAFGMLFGIGSAYLISMRLGQNRRDEAESALNHGFFLLVLSGIFLTVLEFIFFDQIISMLGAQEGSAALEYASRYFRIVLAGQVLSLPGFGLYHCTRSQGFPVMSMISNIAGAVINTILDPIFIFVLKWNVEGAALATIISQFISTAWIIIFSSSSKTVIRLRFSSFKFSYKTVRTIISFGLPPSLLQFAITFVQLLTNYSSGWYGAAALSVPNGGDIAQSGINIVNTTVMLILMPVFGINQGAQAILGFNYGAKKLRRVRNTFMLAVFSATFLCLSGFIMVNLFSAEIVRLFAPNGSMELLAWTPWALKTAIIMLPLTGFQIVSTNMFVVTGRPKISMLMGLTRQVIALIPCMFIFGKIWGLKGVVFAMPVADALAFILTSILIYFELKRISSMMAAAQ